MAYADITFKDKNAVKRWFQWRRLATAARLAGAVSAPTVILDFGAGNGEFCRMMAARFPNAEVVCYEPAPKLMAEARSNLAGLTRIRFCADITEVAAGSVDLLFCLEVLEHLPAAETERALSEFGRLLSRGGTSVIGVPVEIGLPALYKGVFRMCRRFGKFDATPKNVLLAALGFPPEERPVSTIAPGVAFHHHHMGFNHRKLRRLLGKHFKLQRSTSSPFPFFGLWLNPEAYFVIEERT